MEDGILELTGTKCDRNYVVNVVYVPESAPVAQLHSVRGQIV